MKLSVALGTYNGELYMEAQLDSIRTQTRPPDEVIVTDDRSTDRTAEIVREYIERYGLGDSWKVFVNEENLGFEDNFHGAIARCTGDLIFPSDQDDLWYPDKLETMARVMETHEEIDVLCGDYVTFSSDPPAREGGAEVEPQKVILTKKTRFLRSLGCTMAVRRSFLEKNGDDWYPKLAHDEFFWMLSVLDGTCYRYPRVVMAHRIHEGQFSGHMGHGKDKRIRYLEGALRSSELLLRRAEERGASDKTKKLYRKNVAVHRRRLSLVRDRHLAEALPLLFLTGYYYSKKSYPVELRMAMRR